MVYNKFKRLGKLSCKYRMGGLSSKYKMWGLFSKYNVEHELKLQTQGWSGRLASRGSQWDGDPPRYGGPGGRAGEHCAGGDEENPGGEEPQPPLQEWLTYHHKETQKD